MAGVELDEYEELVVGMAVEVIAESPHGLYGEGDTGEISSIQDFDGKVRVYVMLEGSYEPTDIPHTDLVEI